MATPPQPIASAGPDNIATPLQAAPERWVTELSALLQSLDHAAPGEGPALVAESADNQLTQVRLGVAASLFAALRCKHPPAAAHALRVALSTSAWALRAGLAQEERDWIELAALLHDVGVMGVPDRILLKPGPLDREEMALMDGSREMSVEILRSSCAVPEVMDIVRNVAAWYDGSKPGYNVTGEKIPLGARMIAVIEAYDSMTTDHVYRPAMARERAMAELFRCAGSQFDPRLVVQFAEMGDADQTLVRREVARRWLGTLDPAVANSYWHLAEVRTQGPRGDVQALFESRLLRNMHDAVVFVDAGLRVVLWNHGAERLTGISSESIYHRRWAPSLLNMRDEKGEPLAECECPVACVVRSGVQSLRRLTVTGRTGRPVPVDAHVMPVATDEGTIRGAILLLHDASSEISLEQRCQNLHQKATLDPLTQVGNRAEFDRVHEMFVKAHLERQLPCSLIICDLDHFKQVNDTFGHQAGDEAIKSLAGLLKNACRPGDLVARYGGEEFVMLCADCDNASAARIAEQVRLALSQVQQPALDGRSITASFGVTGIQPGDTPETMLRRADRALLTAKARGRNAVVQLGTGSEAPQTESKWGFFQRKPDDPETTIEQRLVTPVPVKMAIEKLRGFVADHCAKIARIEANEVSLEIDDRPDRTRRTSDRPVTFLVDLHFAEERVQTGGGRPPTPTGATRTKIQVRIVPKRGRDRRRADMAERAREVLVSFRSYLMATDDESGDADPAVFHRSKRFLAPWFWKRG